jgi:glycosyltransferase involved in cell wall biosynthesis
MIVKNEAHCIKDCLDSVKQFINYWVICDTGSTDETQKIIRDYLKDIPGELHEHAWENFETNRNLALDLSYNKSDYILWIDADDTLLVNDKLAFNELKDPIYKIEIKHGSITYQRPHLIRNDIRCKWVGVLHEYLEAPPNTVVSKLENVSIIFGGTGSRSKDPNKYYNDALIFEKALLKEPNNERYVFYCAQSYRDSSITNHNNCYKAIEFYNKRISMGGWVEEQFVSALEIGKLLEKIQPNDLNTIETSYLLAHNLLPIRNEALCYLSAYCRKMKLFNKAYFYAKVGSSISRPQDSLFVDTGCYDWKIMDELAIAAFYIGKKQEALFLNRALLSSGKLPENEVNRIKSNLSFCT